jgi:hypothetical protein
MAGMTYAGNEHLVRSNVWTARLKEVFLDQLLVGTKYVDMLTDFPDGDTYNIPSIGQMEAQDFAEGQAVRYTALDTGNFTFSITAYKSAAISITERMKQDSFYMSRLVSSFVPKMNRALMKSWEVDVLALAPNAQTSGNLNAINGAPHRWIGQGTNETIDVRDFARANYSFNKANVPFQNRVAIVDPSVAYAIETMTNLTNVSFNPQFEGIVTSGISSGMRFIRNVYGFDVYVSQNLKANTASETISGVTSTVGVNNIFFCAAGDALPFIGSIRQPPRVESERNKDLQQDEYVTTMRYGVKLFRTEGVICVVTDTDQV